MAMAVCMSYKPLVVSSQSGDPPSSNGEVALVRRHANFHRSVWGDHFIAYSRDEAEFSRMEQEIQMLKADVRKKLEAVAYKPLNQLKMIDAIDGLGLGYHFEEEIEEAMGSMFQKGQGIIGGWDLYHTSLHFRLLRQHGYNVSSDIFKQFVDANGMIKEDLRGNVWGMLGLHEAAQLRVHEDVILDQIMNASIANPSSSLLTNPDPEVRKALKLPIHKNMPRLRTRRYISTYGEGKDHDKTLLKLAKLDFNLLQKRHQHELGCLSIWWKALGIAYKCPFARDRMVEIYMWSLAMMFEPQYGLARALLTKVMSIFTIIDDIYDAFGTADEIDLLTEAITRWDMSLIGQMPEFMKVTYKALRDVFREIEEHVTAEGKSYRVHYARKVLQNNVKAYIDEYLWMKSRHVPTMEEYMQVALVSVAVQLLTTVALVGMGDDNITLESFKWVFSNPNMLTACCVIGRLKDDMVSHKFEQERGHPPSAVECYMNQYGVSEQETHSEFNKQVISAWKDMNESCLKPTAVPLKVLELILNIARIVEVFYTDGDGFTQAQVLMKDEVSSLLVNPIPV